MTVADVMLWIFSGNVVNSGLLVGAITGTIKILDSYTCSWPAVIRLLLTGS